MENLNWNIDLQFDIETHKDNVIKVIGVGGAGGNAVNYMYQKGIKDVDFVVINTDVQDLAKSPIPIKVQIGKNLTDGLGAGAVPDVGEKAAIEDLESVRKVLEGKTKMVFITAGMGGGTGTGAAPVIAKLAREMGILVVGIVTSPFQFEGRKRLSYAEQGIENMRQVVDSLIIINNNKLREVFGNLTYHQAFSKSDEILANAASSISEVITHNYKVNVDFRDVRTVLENSGTAIMGSAVGSGEDRAKMVIEEALDSPLLNDNNIKGAKNVLLLIVSGKSDFTLDEMNEINDYVQNAAGNTAEIILGIGKDERLEEEIGVTIIATGFPKDQQDMIANTKPDRKIHYIIKENEIIDEVPTNIISNEGDEIEITKVELDEFGNKQVVMDFDDEITKNKEELENVDTVDKLEEQQLEKIDFEEKEPNIISENLAELEQENNLENEIMPTLFDNLSDDRPVDKAEKTVHYLSDYKEEEEKEESLVSEKQETEQVTERINFVRKGTDVVKEKEITDIKVDDIDEDIDLAELPIEQALKLSKKRKGNLIKHTDKLSFGGTDKPAFEKQGINIDLTPKSDKSTQYAKIDREGNIQFRDSNSFFNPGID